MDVLSPQDLKTILHSKRANLYYVEHCRLLVNGGRVEYVTDEGRRSLYWNIPIANTTVILLGTGTSVTQAAIRELAKAGVMLGFCGGGGTPLFSANEIEHPVTWFSPQSEYRPTEYLQAWVSFWFDDSLRAQAAKMFQLARLEQVRKQWLGASRWLQDFELDATTLSSAIDSARSDIVAASDVSHLLVAEAHHTRLLYRLAAKATRYGDFSRAKRNSGADPANRFLDHGNYLAYGLGATTAWVLGIPHGLAVLHGKTRRGGLVFDIADLIKDALILPQAFVSAQRGDTEQEFRHACIENLTHAGALDFMIETVQEVALKMRAARDKEGTA
jgi:CRISP-associated protein Cas1